ncbi:hypothetical protein CORC01_01522 [Colletotrichum orchidophilum]|uniref:Uncharacterized protein n=1 Tax=Colletotrichum orchidophilum TaxID=1209926 RepID=A0A1G4BPB2_9PEZI|nr:uncharacterized protein CORC01_01522 [Colletotrichum orchidophilum]OHF03138.1 hypothetical protein CORC01_01522 [Colletotrichum orchidophilum]
MDCDIIAVLYPRDDHNGRSTKAIKASSRYVPPQLKRPRYNRHERESTQPLQNPEASALDYLSGLVVSRTPLLATTDEFNRPIIKDLNYLGGTQVTCNGKGEGFRRDFRWIVGGKTVDIVHP